MKFVMLFVYCQCCCKMCGRMDASSCSANQTFLQVQIKLAEPRGQIVCTVVP